MAAEDLHQLGQRAVVDQALARSRRVVVDDVDDARELRVLLGDLADAGGQALAQVDRAGAEGIPGVLGRDEDADQLAIDAGHLAREVGAAELLGDAGDLVGVDVGEPLVEEQRQDVVAVLGGVDGPADAAGGVPQPGFEGR